MRTSTISSILAATVILLTGCGGGQGKVESEQTLREEAARMKADTDRLISELPGITNQRVLTDRPALCDSYESPGPDGEPHTDYYWDYSVDFDTSGNTSADSLISYLDQHAKRDSRDRAGLTYRITKNGHVIKIVINDESTLAGATGMTRCVSVGKQLR